MHAQNVLGAHDNIARLKLIDALGCGQGNLGDGIWPARFRILIW